VINPGNSSPFLTPGGITFRMSLFGGWVQKPGWHGFASKSLRLLTHIICASHSKTIFAIMPLSSWLSRWQ